MRKLALAVLVLLLAAAGGWYFASPWLAMRGLVDAARSGDQAALAERVDFAALRASAELQLREEIAERARGGDILERIGGAIAGQFAGTAADAAITPQAIANIVTAGSFALPLVPQRYRGQQLEWSVERTGFDSFEAVSTWEDGSAGPVLLFRRDGLGWDLTGIELD